MALEPEMQIPERYQRETESSKTYALDFNTGNIKGMIDGIEAVKQFVQKAIKTPRYRHLIYTDDYGCEIESLIGQGFTSSFTKSEIIRVITEALIYDERINRVYNFEIASVDDEVHVKFNIDTTEGSFAVSEVL